MENNKYHALCSNEILKLISSISNDSNLSIISDKYNNLFNESNTVEFIWPLISTSLLMSENLYKYDKAYKLISDDILDLIEEKLFLYTEDFFYGDISPCLLDNKNNVAGPFSNYIKVNFGEDDNDYLQEESGFEYDMRFTFEKLRSESSYGCNDSIIDDGFINIKKFIERTRNALAHSNYEVMDEDNIRLYHYNANTKKLDFNVILDPSVIVLIVDELNEIASQKYSNFMNFYFDNPSEELLKEKLTDERIIEYIMSFNMFDEDIAKNILDGLKTKEEFLNAKDKKKVIMLNKTIYEIIKPSYDVGIIINNYLYCDDNGKIISDELFPKYHIFEYLNSEYYSTVEGEVNDKVYMKNKFQFLLLSLLNCTLLNGYNLNEGKDIGIIDFSKMRIDDEIFKNFLLKNGVKAVYTINLLEQEIEKNKKEVETKEKSISKKHEILMEHDIDNDYFNVVLPSQIKKLEMEKTKINIDTISKIIELEKAKEQGCMYNFDKNISQFVFNHLRNSLAHGYVKFSNDMDLSNICNMIISFEDYNPDNKKELTFKGSITLGELLKTITTDEYVSTVFGINSRKSTGEDVLIKK